MDRFAWQPDNVLVSEFLRGKISDFGTSRGKSTKSAVTTVVGTPLFCAPEMLRGETYDEMVDVYSFGMLLLNMGVGEHVLDFLRERWVISFKKSKAPSNIYRVLRPMQEEGWRPVTLDWPIEEAGIANDFWLPHAESCL